MLYLPCSHLALCAICDAENDANECPICRCKVDPQRSVYVGSSHRRNRNRNRYGIAHGGGGKKARVVRDTSSSSSSSSPSSLSSSMSSAPSRGARAGLESETTTQHQKAGCQKAIQTVRAEKRAASAAPTDRSDEAAVEKERKKMRNSKDSEEFLLDELPDGGFSDTEDIYDKPRNDGQ